MKGVIFIMIYTLGVIMFCVFWYSMHMISPYVFWSLIFILSIVIYSHKSKKKK
jgi:TctA family transporter